MEHYDKLERRVAFMQALSVHEAVFYVHQFLHDGGRWNGSTRYFQKFELF